MNIESYKVDKATVQLALSGRLDTVNAPLLEQKIKQWGDDISELILDFAQLEYISSMGLRVLLQTYKAMKEKNKKLIIKNMSDSVREVFGLTGFLNLMIHEEKFVVIRKDADGCIALSFNGEMQPDNVSMVKAELSGIRDNRPRKALDVNDDGIEPIIKIILDMENLTAASPRALKLLNQAIDETEWRGREIAIRNVPGNLRNDFIEEGIAL